MSQKTLETSTANFDPLIKHVHYCCLSKEERSFVVANLMSELSRYIPVAKLTSTCIFTAKTWETVLKLIPQGKVRNHCYTRVLDCGASFSDGTDGIEWGASMGLWYHGVPASRILARRRCPTYCGQQLGLFREHIVTNQLDPSKITEFWNRLQRQLTMIVNSTRAIEKSTPSLKSPINVK